MNPVPTLGKLTLRFLTLRDWVELTEQWMSARQVAQESALRRGGASATEIAKAAQDYAQRQGTFETLGAMCKTSDGCLMILQRAQKHAGVSDAQLTEAMSGLSPNDIVTAALRCCGFRIEETDSGNP
jgi:hypothetical protein